MEYRTLRESNREGHMGTCKEDSGLWTALHISLGESNDPKLIKTLSYN